MISSADEIAAASAARALAALGFRVVGPRSPLTVGLLVVDAARHEVSCNDEPLSLTPNEFRLLVALAERAGLVVSPNTLLSEAWGPEYVDSPEYVKPVVSRLRRKLAACAGDELQIETVRGFGYRLRAGER